MQGVYEHYRGGIYTVLMVGRMSTNGAPDEREEVVIYVSHTNGTVWVRNRKQFDEFVQWPDGVIRSRFRAKGGE